MYGVSMFDENKMIQTIILGNDWQDVLAQIIVEEGMDPLSIDIVKLTDSFMGYMQKLEKFDFRIPARFILISAILLRMKCELLLEEEEKKQKVEGEQIPPIDVENVPLLSPPALRKPTRMVTLNELVTALNKVFEFKEKKEGKRLRIRMAAEELIEPEEDIEIKIKAVYDQIMRSGIIKFSDLVPMWKRKDIVETFVPLLHLSSRGRVVCDQEEMFKEIVIKLKDLA